MPRGNGTDFVGSAVFHVGIPLSLWDGLLEVCEWAAWREDWKSLSDTEWADAIQKRAGSRRRLTQFLTDNRESASTFVQEILDARDILSRDQSLGISDIAQASILRQEYFDEVPETAEFLRPQNPDSLFRDRAKLIWNDRKQKLSLFLPAVAPDRLPATWQIGERTQKAASSPDELVLNALAFRKRLIVRLDSGQRSEEQLMRGPEPWGLFDLEAGGRLINSDRDELPLKNYELLSLAPITIVSLEGFAKEENPENEPFELSDGTTCYVTRLWPTGKFARIILKRHDAPVTIRFKPRARIESRFFVGRGYRAAFFDRASEGVIRTDSLPELCVVIPPGWFRDNYAELKSRFRVREGDNICGGEWQGAGTQADNDRELYVWRWSKSPFIEARPQLGPLRDLGELGGAFKRRDLSGIRTFCFDCFDASDIPVTHTIELVYPNKEIENCWTHLPGAFLPWFLLCQSSNGMTWEDLKLAKDVIAPSLTLSSPYLLRKCANEGLLVQHGQRWSINESRAVLSLAVRGKFELRYCGNPPMIWGLYRRMYHENGGRYLPTIEVVNKHGEIPYLSMRWPLSSRRTIGEYLKEHGAVIVKELWTH